MGNYIAFFNTKKLSKSLVILLQQGYL